jgi:2,3-bisphosphoglycerate-independent phosphoglycerate mutase
MEQAPKSFFLVFLVDGMGISPMGSADPVRQCLSWLNNMDLEGPTSLPAGGWASLTTADLGVEGLPQSATGHTTILTGLNAARRMGRHVPGFPTPTLRRMIEAHNLMGALEQWGLRTDYLNAFAPMHPVVVRRGLKSAATVAALANGKRLRTIQDIGEQRALHHEFTNGLLIRRGELLPRWSPKQAGRILARMAMELDLGFFEYFLTDLAGHSMDMQEARSQMRRIREFLEGILEEADLSQGHLLVCSDHGNLEDLSVRTHTRNPVPTMVWGPCAERLALRIKTIEQIAPAVMGVLAQQQVLAPGKAGSDRAMEAAP